VLVTLLSLAIIDIRAADPTRHAITVRPMATTSVSAQPSAPALGAGLRQTEIVDNRTLPRMQGLLAQYWHSDWLTIVFGIASDASVVTDPLSQSWTRTLTNHGLLGTALLWTAGGVLSLSLWRGSATVALFLLLFWLSFSQRPVIWVPYALLILICGASAAQSWRISTARP
jgi:hypothetical protein